MKKIKFWSYIIVPLLLTINCKTAFSQTDDIKTSYALGRYFYQNKDYLQAYKFLLIYRTSNLTTLNLTKNVSLLRSINNAVNYCESQLKEGMFEIKRSGKGYMESTPDTLKKINKRVQPGLPAEIHL
jgi:hypothetical protein